MAAALHTALHWRTFSPQQANETSKGFQEETRRKENNFPTTSRRPATKCHKRILRNTATAALEHTAQGLQVVPLPCGQSPEEPPSAEMARAIQLVSTPGHRHAGLQILIFNASWQLHSTTRSTGGRFLRQQANETSKGFQEETRRKKTTSQQPLGDQPPKCHKRILRNTATAALEHTAQGLQVVPLPCGQSPEEPPSAEMARAIQLVSTPGHRHAGRQILIFNASWQLLSTPRSTSGRFLRNKPIKQARVSKKRGAERKQPPNNLSATRNKISQNVSS